MINAVLYKEHRPQQVIGEAADPHPRACAYSQEEIEYLVARTENLPSFLKGPEALARLKTHYSLAVLANRDPNMLGRAQS